MGESSFPVELAAASAAADTNLEGWCVGETAAASYHASLSNWRKLEKVVGLMREEPQV